MLFKEVNSNRVKNEHITKHRSVIHTAGDDHINKVRRGHILSDRGDYSLLVESSVIEEATKVYHI